MWSPSLYQAARAGKRCWAFLAACFAQNGVINMAAWPVQDAKDKFCQLLRQAASHGPQIVTKRGVEIAVVVPIEIWRTLEAERPTSIACSNWWLRERDTATTLAPRQSPPEAALHSVVKQPTASSAPACDTRSSAQSRVPPRPGSYSLR